MTIGLSSAAGSSTVGSSTAGSSVGYSTTSTVAGTSLASSSAVSSAWQATSKNANSKEIIKNILFNPIVLISYSVDGSNTLLLHYWVPAGYVASQLKLLLMCGRFDTWFQKSF
jgi:hypothetical protein